MSRKILIISGIRIFPPQSGGHLRTANLAKALARSGQQVVLYSLTARRSDYQQGLKAQSHLIENGLTELVNASIWWGLCQTIFRRLGLPRIWLFFLARYCFLPQRLRKEIEHADTILFDFPFFSFVSQLRKDKQVLLISHNLEYRIFQQDSWWKASLISSWVHRLEAKSAEIYDAVLACTAEDRNFFLKSGKSAARVIEIANGVDGLWYQRDNEQRQILRASLGISEDETVLLFTASAYEPNRQAYLWLKSFAKENQALLRKKRLRFLVVGSVARQPLSDDVLIVSSFVDDIQPYFSASDAVINPVESGSGSNVKIYEAIAAGLPIVSTKFGARGVNLIPNHDYIPFEQSNLLAALEILLDRRSELEAWGTRVLNQFRCEVLMDSIVKAQLVQFLSDSKK